MIQALDPRDYEAFARFAITNGYSDTALSLLRQAKQRRCAKSMKIETRQKLRSLAAGRGASVSHAREQLAEDERGRPVDHGLDARPDRSLSLESAVL